MAMNDEKLLSLAITHRSVLPFNHIVCTLIDTHISRAFFSSFSMKYNQCININSHSMGQLKVSFFILDYTNMHKYLIKMFIFEEEII